MGSVNYHLKGIRIKIAIFGTPRSGKHSFLENLCKITSTQGNLQMFSDENGDVFSFVPIVKNIQSENINLQIKMMGARDKKGDGIIWQSIFKEIDGIVFICKAKEELVQEAIEYIKKMQQYILHFGPRKYDVPMVLFYNRFESDINIEDFDRRVNPSHLSYFAGDLSDIPPFLSAVRYIVKESLKKHQADYEKLGGQKNIEDAFEIVEVFRPSGAQIAEGSVIITHPKENPITQDNVKIERETTPPPSPDVKKDTSNLSKTVEPSEGSLEELSELLEERPDETSISEENTVKIRSPLFDVSELADRINLFQNLINEIEQASHFFALKIASIRDMQRSILELIERYQEFYNRLTSENREMSQKIENQKRHIAEIEKIISNQDSLEDKITTLTKEKEELKSELDRLHLEHEKTDKLLSEKERIIQDKESLITIKMTESSELMERLKSCEIERDRLKVDYLALEERLKELENKNAILHSDHSKLSNEYSKLQEEVLALKAEGEELQSNLGIKERELQQQKETSNAEIQKLKLEINAISAELNNKSAAANDEEVRRLSSELINIQIELAQKNDRIKDLEALLSEKIREIEELKSSASQKKPTTTDTINPQMLAKTIISNLKMKYWDDMLTSLKNGSFQKKYNPLFIELKRVYESRIPPSVENREQIFQEELKGLFEELKKNV